MRFFSGFFMLFMVMASVCSCNNFISEDSQENRKPPVGIRSIDFSPDLSKITLDMQQSGDVGKYRIADTSSVKIKVTEANSEMKPVIDRCQPVIDSISRYGCRLLKEKGVNIMVLMDVGRTPNERFDQMEYLNSIFYTFCNGNMFVSFILPEGEVSEIMPASQYLFERNLKSTPVQADIVPTDNEPYLFRSMSRTIELLADCNTKTPLDSSSYTALLVISGSNVYDDLENVPFDSEHFGTERMLVRQSMSIPSNISVNYLSMDASRKGGETSVDNLMKLLCRRTNGVYADDFDWVKMQNSILRNFGLEYNDFKIHLTNPDGQLYFGGTSYFIVDFLTKQDSLLFSVNGEFVLGSSEHVCVVGHFSWREFIMSGVAVAVVLLLLSYMLMQFVIPYVRYLAFKRKYVTAYTGVNMTFNGKPVADTCYFCKTPFKIGDRIVAKCSHIMHKECWDFNDYHCPEYGLRCTEGSHFYDSDNLLNSRNTFFCLKWIVSAIVVGFVCWLLVVTRYEIGLVNGAVIASSRLILGEEMSEIADDSAVFSMKMVYMTIVIMYISVLLAAAISYLSSYRRVWYNRLLDVFARASVVGVCTFIIVFVANIVEMFLYNLKISFPMRIFIWSAIPPVIIYFSTFRSRVKPCRKRYVASSVIGFVAFFLFEPLGNLDSLGQAIDFIYPFMFFCIGVAMAVARPVSRSNRYCLHVSGAVKDMDIALYKWFTHNPKTVVTIGAANDCSLRIDWDMKSSIAPVQAEIRMKDGELLLSKVDRLVMCNNRPLGSARPHRLYHNDFFTIGNTKFRYLEF